MPKTVHVVDEAGNRYEATYLKRAQGLVKKGRARFIDENTICLVCPPNQNDFISEDKTMENTMKHTDDTIETTAQTVEENKILLPETDDPECIRFTNAHNINYCLKKIDEIKQETESIESVVKSIASIESLACPSGGTAEGQAKAILEVFRLREETNQKKIDFYRDMIERFLPAKKDPKLEQERRQQYLKWLKDIFEDGDWELDTSDLIKLYKEFE